MPVESCPLCGSRDRRIVYKGTLGPADIRDPHPDNYACTASSLAMYGDLFRCEACGLIYAGFQPSERRLGLLYQQVVDRVYEQEEEGRCRTFAKAVGDLTVLCPAKGRLCDIGCYTGVFLELARERGWDVYGLELSDWARAIARDRRNLRCFASFAEMKNLGNAFLDAVVMWDVIEHVPHPRQLVTQAGGLLKPGGVLGLSTIVLDSLSARILGRRYPFLMEMHLVYFTRKTLVRLLEECGFDVVAYRRHRRYVSVAYVLGKFAVFRPLKKVEPLWRRMGQCFFSSSVGLRDVYARKRG